MKNTDEAVTVITQKVGYFNTDILLGFEAGLLGRQRIGKQLWDRLPPVHLTGDRRYHWMLGYDLGKAQKKAPFRETSFHGMNAKGPVIVRRKGWGVPRAKVVTQMERAGCFGPVYVYYTERGSIIRKVECGI